MGAAFRAHLAGARAQAAGAVVCTAYLELMRPSFDEAVARSPPPALSSIRIVPLFLGPGGHVRRICRGLSSARAAAPALEIRLEAPIGEQPAVIEAIAAAIAAGISS